MSEQPKHVAPTALGVGLDGIIRVTIREAIDGRIDDLIAELATQRPALLDSDDIARELKVSTVHVRKMSKRDVDPMPHVTVGDSARRYELAAVLEWCRRQKGGE